MTKHYDYILAGGGLAGLSLACHLVNSPLRDRSILIVDPDTKERNDRTWSYWTRQPGLFDGAVTHAWDSLRFVGNGVETIVPLGEYRYKTIRGDDFYRFARQLLAASPNVEFLHGRVERIDDGPEMATVVVDGKTLTCDWVFDSLPAQAEDSRYTHLKLYFRGWEVETPVPAFDTQAATFLDFRTPTQGDVRFFYVLPFAPNRALVEYTLFTSARVTHAEAEQAIDVYLRSVLGVTDYRIVSQEGGCLPVTDQPMPRRLGKRVMASASTAAGSSHRPVLPLRASRPTRRPSWHPCKRTGIHSICLRNRPCSGCWTRSCCGSWPSIPTRSSQRLPRCLAATRSSGSFVSLTRRLGRPKWSS